MDLSWVLEPATLAGFFTLLILEVVLGIDNLVFVAILANKVKPQHRDKARLIGLGLAVVMRVIMLGLMAYVMTWQEPLFTVLGNEISGKDLIMLGGGLFLLYKATTELHERLEGHAEYADVKQKKGHASFGSVVAQIVILDLVFSVDAVITAAAMVEHITIAMAAVIVAMGIMIWASKPLTDFVNKHPTVVMLCLGFLLMIGFSLIAEGLGFKIPKGYLYAAIGFSILIEIFNQVSTKNRKKNDFSVKTWRSRAADNVLGMMGIRETLLAKDGAVNGDSSRFEDNEKWMIKSVLTLAERPILGVMTPRPEIERLDISQSQEQQNTQLQRTPFSRLMVVGKAGIDEPLGYINKKDLLAQVLSDGAFSVHKALRQPLILTENATVLNAMELFRAQSADLALVVDEFGAILGMVTMKDLMETIAGDFPEEYEREDSPSLEEHEDHSFTVDGSLEYTTLAQQIQLPPLDDSVDYHTVAGLMMDELQAIANVGDKVDYHQYRFTVLEKVGQRIERIKVERISDEEWFQNNE
ncbi:MULTISPECIES: TerC family protein [Vitreoscilla]|uniref:TerC family protein n=1 Tax=Vitreoscilla stercoraria TaxID=61 RepID=A0ABY4EA32_VITST|nr:MULTISPECIES: TerC family protein [Vitreoscilla]QJQ52409.1 integral membrane protein TerC [Vitreoscilla sp. C1]UOO92617.1 TerC family protein [Vitreoscilla stercoraria]